ncbi:hypothetical protein CDL15_Pgr012654 [Punica granatum]|uniref:Extensin-like n=1 Tax=Punica granatum TaxID=22663 RepID=A0A218WRR8_PUNGR|nr:hypothetical protein CDL15_Pgr012654 [Punica granatum]
MAEGDHVDVSEEVNPSVPTLSQPPQTHAPPPLTPAGVLPVYSSALPTHLPPPASSGAPLPPASPTSTATNDQARIAALEGTVNQMATNMAGLLALLRGPNRASSSSTPPPGPGPTVDPTPWAPPTQAPENVVAPAPPALALPTHLPPPASSGAPLPPASPTSTATNDQARIAALEGTVNQMATNMAELLALLRGPNRVSSSSTPPPGPGPTVDPTPGAPPTQAPENVVAPAPPTLYTSTIHPFTSQLPPPPAPSVVPLPPATFLTSEHILSAPPPVSIPAPAMTYAVPPPTVFPTPTAPAPTHLQATELPPYPPLQPHAGLSYQAPPPINTAFHEPGTPTHAAQFASPTHFFPEADAEQERWLKRMEETIRALQANDVRPDARYGDWGSAFAPPVMRSLRPAKATIFIASPHTTGGSTGALQSPHYLISSPGLHAVRTRMLTLVGARMRAFGLRGLGVSTFPWGRVTDTRERRSRHLSFYDPKVEGG